MKMKFVIPAILIALITIVIFVYGRSSIQQYTGICENANGIDLPSNGAQEYMPSDDIEPVYVPAAYEIELNDDQDDIYDAAALPVFPGFVSDRVRIVAKPQWALYQVGSFREGMSWAIAWYQVEGMDWRSFRYGYINIHGEIVIPFEHLVGEIGTSAAVMPNDFSQGLVFVSPINTGGTDYCAAGFFDKNGELIIPIESGWASSFSEGLAWVFDYGFIDNTGSLVLPTTYAWAFPFSNGAAGIVRDMYNWAWGGWSYIDIYGNALTPCIYCDVGTFSDGLAAVRIDNKTGFINNRGEVVIPLDFDVGLSEYDGRPYLRHFREDLAAVSQIEWLEEWNQHGQQYFNRRWGFIDTRGDIAVPLLYSWAHDFFDGRAMVSREDEEGGSGVGFVDTYGNEIIPIGKFDSVSPFSEGFAAVSRGGWGFIDRYGNEVIPLIYNNAFRFSHGLAAVQEMLDIGNAGKWGFIDIEGNVVVPFIFNDVRDFTEGVAWVRYGDLWGLIGIK
ncbi:MAG: WG repeat-containing protein [Defluviitaleaceae bacterium]|nr:WG repeat-containing protein [Defluviitaleaceae bacterium]